MTMNIMPHQTIPRQRRLNPIVHRIAMTCCLLVAVALTLTAQGRSARTDAAAVAVDRPLHLHEAECTTATSTSSSSDEGNTSCSPLDPSSSSEIIYWNNEGKLSLRHQAYSGGTNQYGHEIISLLSKILTNSAFLEQLDLEVRTKSGQEALRNLFDDLMTLTDAHQKALIEVINDSDAERGTEEFEMDRLHAEDHFNKAINAVETALYVYQRVWNIMEQEENGRGLGGRDPSFSMYDKEAIASGLTSAFWRLASLYERRCNKQDPSSPDNVCPKAYKYFIKADDWAEKSLEILGFDLNLGIVPVTTDANANKVTDAKATFANIQARQGVFLLKRYSSGFVKDDDDLLFNPQENGQGEEDSTELSEPQKRILTHSLIHLAQSQMLYTDLSKDGDYFMSLAGSCHFMGVVFNHLREWSSAAQQFEAGIGLYEKQLKKYSQLKRGPEMVEITSKLMQTTKSLKEAYLNLPGQTGKAKKVFMEHIDCRRFLEDRIPFSQPLADEEEEDDSEPSFDKHEMPSNLPYQDYLSDYRELLDDYLQRDIVLRLDYASYSHQDSVYEGYLRFSIGSILLDQDEELDLVSLKTEARDQLETAVQLLRDGIDSKDTFYNKKTLKIMFAKALMNLSSAHISLKKWRSGYEAFEESMDMFAVVLGEGETPMDPLDLDTENEEEDNAEEDVGVQDDEKEDSSKEEDGVDFVWGQYVYVDSYQAAESNHTSGFNVGVM